MARKYDVQGTQTYLIVALCLGAVGLWHLYDGWFPRESVLKVHPQEVVVFAEKAGMIDSVDVALEDEVPAGKALMVMKTSDPEQPSVSVMMADALDEETKVKAGYVKELYVKETDEVKPGEMLVRLKSTGDSYYLYNKTTAVILLGAALVCAYIHKVAK